MTLSQGPMLWSRDGQFVEWPFEKEAGLEAVCPAEPSRRLWTLAEVVPALAAVQRLAFHLRVCLTLRFKSFFSSSRCVRSLFERRGLVGGAVESRPEPVGIVCVNLQV